MCIAWLVKRAAGGSCGWGLAGGLHAGGARPRLLAAHAGGEACATLSCIVLWSDWFMDREGQNTAVDASLPAVPSCVAACVIETFVAPC